MKYLRANTGSRIVVLLFLTFLVFGCSFFRSNPGSGTFSDLVQAENYYDQEDFRKAIFLLDNHLLQHPDDLEAKLLLGRSLFASDKPEEALNQFTEIIGSGLKVPPETFFWAGRCNHLLDRFAEADVYYRRYVMEEENADLELLSFYLEQIGSARQAGVAEARYLIENAGKKVNSALDEFRPIFSPNVDERFYFSIHDPDETSDSRISAVTKPSMSYAEVSQGIWMNQGPLDQELTGSTEFQLVEMTKSGQEVIFVKPDAQGTPVLYQKKFEEIPGQPAVSKWFHPVYDASLGDRDLYMINDSAYLFSSERLEGFGGYDIFVTFQRLGTWLVQNLGSEINSSYDEISPFLSNDGRELYFSSNSEKSIGGYDIFFATFDDEMESWTTPHNMLPPLNSGQNEVDFRLSKDGRHALFTSDRKDGLGGLDIYHVYFDEQKKSQIQESKPGYFYQVRAFRSFSSDSRKNVSLNDRPVYELPVLYFGERPSVITPTIRQELDQVLEYGKLFPHTGLLLQIFTDKQVQDQFALYKPVLVLKNVTDYLKAGGLDPSRIQWRLYGNQYPRYTKIPSGAESKITPVRSSNQRLEFDFTNTENLPIQFGVPHNDDQSGTSPYQVWKTRTQDLHFRIQLLDSDQLIKGTDYSQTEDLMLLITGDNKRYIYYGGIFETVKEARQALGQYMARGFLNAEIVAFLGPDKIMGNQMTPAMIQSYPELKEYIIYQK
ncbi:MAG TPA: hypothetical protein VKZ54_02660 [Membranihabitans sp.]|nr:hypothetical protein [Membranihabitans sp.]